MSENNLGLGK